MNVPKRKPRDAKKIRDEHLANLALEASNNQLNQNASLMLKNTGRSSLLPDQNTPTDKYATEEGKKQLVRDFLSGNNIMNAFNAEEVIQRLTPSQIRFFDQYKDYIKKDFKGKQVPVEVFVNYLIKLQRKEAETQGVEYNLQQVSGGGLLLQLSNQWINPAQENALQTAISQSGMPPRARAMLQENLNQLNRLLLTDAEMAKAQTFVLDTRTRVLQENSDILSAFPQPEQLIYAIMDKDFASAIDITQLPAGLIDSSHDLKDFIRRNDPAPEEEPEEEPEEFDAPPGFGEFSAPAKKYDPFGGPSSPSTLTTKEAGSWEGGDWGSSASTAEAPPYATTRPRTKKTKLLPTDDFNAFSVDQKIGYLESLSPNIISQISDAAGQNYGAVPENRLGDWYRRAYITLSGNATGSGIKGKGLVKRKTPAERSNGYEKPKPYRQFGRYLVHAPKLEEGILMIKTPAGAKIKDLPSQHITPELKKVLRVMAKGEQPSFAHCQGLGVEDQSKLHHIIRHSQFGMELPDRDEDKEINQFEILKGEIEAGNDNKELIKKFKGMLIRFTREGRIPRREANQVLEELLHLGH